MSKKSVKKSVSVKKLNSFLREEFKALGLLDEDKKKIESIEKPIDSKFIEALITKSSRKEIPIFDDHREIGETSKKLLEDKSQIVSNGTKFKPIRKIVSSPDSPKGRVVEFDTKNKLDINSSVAKTVAGKYGPTNYLHTIDISPTIIGNEFSFTNTIIPDVSVKLLDPEKEDSATAVKIGKEFFEQNKDEMQKQMNVVAMYSIKDSKPFYYISSAEARLAIDYINLCRKYKKDIFKINSETITEYVNNVEAIINSIKGQSGIDVPKVIVWNGVNDCEIYDNPDLTVSHALAMETLEADFRDQYINIRTISKQVFVPYKVKSETITFQKFEVELEQIDIASIKRIIKLHEPLTVLHSYSHYIICGKHMLKYILLNVANPNITEKEIFGIVGEYKNEFGQKPIFLNEKIRNNSFVILSRSLRCEDTIFISEYEVIGQSHRDKMVKDSEDKPKTL